MAMSNTVPGSIESRICAEAACFRIANQRYDQTAHALISIRVHCRV
jgi:hypothetical protein